MPVHGTLGIATLLQAEISGSFTVTAGIGFILALVALAVLALYNLAAELARHAGRGGGAVSAAPYAGSGPSPGP